MKRISVAMIATFLWTMLLPLAANAAEGAEVKSLPQPTPNKLPRWRGFNLTNKFQRDWNNGPFEEDDFKLIHELGFNFVRLPMDYRVWTDRDDWTKFNEPPLKEIDQAVEWGGKYGIHVLINFHRAPGYTVASPPEARSLWTDAEAQRVCALHWAMFARRYKGVPNERLSFNLFNEPANIEPAVYVEVVKKIAAAIRAEDPNRLIISDGLGWGRHPIPELIPLRIAQATRGYTPMDVTHYKANWVSGADQYPLPQWPRLAAYGTLYQPGKSDLSEEARRPLVIELPAAGNASMRVRVDVVSSRAVLVAKADGAVVWQKEYVCGPGEGEWKKAVHQPQWNTYQNVYDRDYEFPLPDGARRVELAVTAGDWLRLSEIGLKVGDAQEHVLPLRADWDAPPARVRFAPGAKAVFQGQGMEDRQWLWETLIVPWKEAQAQGAGVMVGEFGAFNQTPHDVVLAWMEDCLQNWQKAGWGWALWNFRGSFGILDSGRKDVDYEDFHGHKLDRKMLDLLQKY